MTKSNCALSSFFLLDTRDHYVSLQPTTSNSAAVDGASNLHRIIRTSPTDELTATRIGPPSRPLALKMARSFATSPPSSSVTREIIPPGLQPPTSNSFAVDDASNLHGINRTSPTVTPLPPGSSFTQLHIHGWLLRAAILAEQRIRPCSV